MTVADAVTAPVTGTRFVPEPSVIGYLILDRGRADSVWPRGKVIWAPDDDPGTHNGHWTSASYVERACRDLNCGHRNVVPANGVLTLDGEPSDF